VLDVEGRLIDFKTASRRPSHVSPDYAFQLATYQQITPGASGEVRTADYLRFIYPHSESRYYGVQLTAGDAPAGWVQMLDCQTLNRSCFGELRVAALVGGVGPPEAIPSLVHSAVEAASGRNADIVISNQIHRDWTSALRAAGFWKGPSNYLLALSKELRKLVEPLGEALPRIHFSRGDGDGRVNLTGQD
jgi:hypothetical protein